MTPTLRVTIFHSSLDPGGLVVENPDGWDSLVTSFTRHKEFHSLIKEFKGNFSWFGLCLTTLKKIESDFGPNTIVTVMFDLTYDYGSSYNNLFEGKFKLFQLEEIIVADRENYRLNVPIIRDDFWTNFIGFLDSPVDLQAAVDLKGNVRDTIDSFVLPMPSQKIRQVYQSKPTNIADIITQPSPPNYALSATNPYAPFYLNKEIRDEITKKFNYIVAAQSTIPGENFSMDFDGDYEAIGTIYIADSFFIPVGNYSDVELNIKINDGAPIPFTRTSIIGFDGFNATEVTKFEYSDVHSLVVGDKVTLYWEYTGGSNSTFVVLYDGSTIFSGVDPQVINPDLTINGDTVFIQTSTDAYLIKNALKSIVSKVCCQDDAVLSDYLDTCAGQNAIFRGKHNRGYSFDQKPFTMSMNEWWKGADPLLFLGLGYTEVMGVKKIEVEDRAKFFDASTSINISNVEKISRRYDLEKIFSSIEFRYKKGQTESNSGLDDTQTARTWNTDMPDGTKDSTICEWLAASMPIEQSRRKRVTAGEDDRNDEDIMVVALVPDGDNWLPEFGDVFASITNLLNANFRVNVRHSATRLFRRAIAWYNGCMAFSIVGNFNFGSGEGNFSMTSQLDPADCEAVSNPDVVVDEGASFVADPDNALFVPVVYELEDVPFTFEQFQAVDAERKKCIGVSRTNVGHAPMAIIDLDWSVFKSRANILVIQRTTQGL